MSSPKIHISKCLYENEIEMVDKILTIYSLIKYEKPNRLREFEKNVLIYYVRKGLSEETLDMIAEDLKKEQNYLHGINKHLRDKGYLVSSKTNMRKFDLNQELKELRESFINNKINLYTIALIKTK